MLNDLTTTTLTGEQLKSIGPPDQFLSRPVTIKSGENLQMGAIISKETASGKYIVFDKDGSDGSQNPVGFLGEAVDATGGDQHSWVALRGNFLTSKLDGLNAEAKAALGYRQFELHTLL